MSNLITSKSMLAKLMASENINIQHQNVSTAYFDLKSRTMVLPIWKDMDGDLYDLLTGHEVGHALETPQQGWHNALHDADGNFVSSKFKSFLNVIEDARIEKKIKRKYPGLSKSFANAYKGLHERDFFGISKLGDLSKLNLIDRINIRFKLGTHVVVSFNDDERAFVREIEDADTWEQVLDIATRVFAYVKENEKEKINSITDMQIESQDDQDSSEEDDGDTDGETSDDFEYDMDGNSSAEAADEDDSEAETSSDGESKGDADSEENDDEPQSVTDKIFRRKEGDLVNETGIVSMITLPEANLKNIIYRNAHLVGGFEQSVSLTIKNSIYGRNGMDYAAVANKCVKKFNKNNKKFISHILKEFEMRKKASQYARTQTASTGELDMNVLHKYKFNSDLFKKISVVGKGKSHGMILFLDMSGSMHSIFRNTVEQLMVLVSFCKLANIPFDVYGFNDDSHSGLFNCGMDESNRFTTLPDDLIISSMHFHMPHIIGSSLSKTQYRRSFDMLAILANEYGQGYGYSNDTDHGFLDHHAFQQAGFGLNTTPFVQTLLASREIISNFKNKHKSDVVNVVYLTDGEGSGGTYYPKSMGANAYRGIVYLIDKKTKKKVKVEDIHGVQTALTELVRDITGCKHIGFYLGRQRDLKNAINYRINNVVDQQQAKKSLRDNNFFATNSNGYNKYFYMTASVDAIREGEMKIDSSMTKSKMAKEFANAQNSKRSNRVLVSKFAEEIAA